jgi:hypothetical protein
MTPGKFHSRINTNRFARCGLAASLGILSVLFQLNQLLDSCTSARSQLSGFVISFLGRKSSFPPAVGKINQAFQRLFGSG